MLLPGELLPLHIFEERYKRMIGHCLDDGEPFGIVFRDDEGGARRIGCEARVTEVTERFDDGRLNIVVTGERPFRVLDRFEAAEYPAGEVEPIEPAARADAADEAADEPADAREAFAELVRRVGGEPPEPAELEADDSYGIAARVELPAETKQRLLELRSEPERMRVLAAALGALVDAVARSREIAERAQGQRQGDRRLSRSSRVLRRRRPRRRGAGRRRRAARRSPGRGRPRGRRRRRRCAPASARPRSRAAASRSSAASSIPGSACTAPVLEVDPGRVHRLGRPRSPSPTRRTIVCRIAERIRFEPPLPSPASSSPSRRTTVGDIIDGIRRPAAWRWKPSGFRSCSPSMLLTWTPVPGDDEARAGAVRAGDAGAAARRRRPR